MHPEFKWFFLLFGALFVLWLIAGLNSNNATNRTHPFIDQPTQVGGTGKIYTLDQLKNNTRP